MQISLLLVFREILVARGEGVEKTRIYIQKMYPSLNATYWKADQDENSVPVSSSKLTFQN